MISSVNENGVSGRASLDTAGRCKNGYNLMQGNFSISIKIKMYISIDPEIILLGTNSKKKFKKLVYKNMWTMI